LTTAFVTVAKNASIVLAAADFAMPTSLATELVAGFK